MTHLDTTDHRTLSPQVYKPLTQTCGDSVLTLRFVVSNVATFARQSNICSLFSHPVLSVPTENFSIFTLQKLLNITIYIKTSWSWRNSLPWFTCTGYNKHESLKPLFVISKTWMSHICFISEIKWWHLKHCIGFTSWNDVVGLIKTVLVDHIIVS